MCLLVRADLPVPLLEFFDLPLFRLGQILRAGRIEALGFA
jgi:hypothetical protein